MSESVCQSRRRLLMRACALASLHVMARAATRADPRETLETRTTAIPPAAARAPIVDRHGIVLANTVRVPSVYVDPSRITDRQGTADALVRLIPGLDRAAIVDKLARRDRAFAWVARRVAERVGNAVIGAGLPGVGIRHEASRSYPLGPLVAHAVGFADGESHHGLAGIERSQDERLTNQRDPLRLSIDSRVQSAVREELVGAVARYRASGGAALVMDAQSGELITFTSLPDFDPNDRRAVEAIGQRNHLTAEQYEMGGVFELFSVALALENHRVTLTSRFDVHRPYKLGRVRLRDEEPASHPLALTEAFARSSLIAAAMIAQRSSPDEFRSLFERAGLLTTLPFELPERLPKPHQRADQWMALSRTTMGYGYGLAVMPLQALVAATAMVTARAPLRPTLLAGAATEGDRTGAVSPETASRLRALLRYAVTNGTGHAADVPGLDVGGKTGTADKFVGGAYRRDRQTTWFFAAFPVTAPVRYSVLVMLDEPHAAAGRGDTGSARFNVVPTAGRILSRIGPILPTTGG